MAEFAASHTGRETVVADGDLLIHIGVGKVIAALGHSAHEHADGLVRAEPVNIFADTYNWSVETERDLSAVRRQVISNGVLNHLEQLLL